MKRAIHFTVPFCHQGLWWNYVCRIIRNFLITKSSDNLSVLILLDVTKASNHLAHPPLFFSISLLTLPPLLLLKISFPNPLLLHTTLLQYLLGFSLILLLFSHYKSLEITPRSMADPKISQLLFFFSFFHILTLLLSPDMYLSLSY